MDLVQTVRKEGSRGGTGDFKWSDVQASTHREHYLGHSIMAPTGRWAKGKDLTWYAKGDQGSDQDAAAVSEADARKEEIRKIKEAEQDAMARALGLPVPDRSNPNNQELGTRREVQQVIKEAGGRDQPVSKGIGYERESAAGMANETPDPERIEGNVDQQDKELRYALNEYKRRHKSDRQAEAETATMTESTVVTEAKTGNGEGVRGLGTGSARTKATQAQKVFIEAGTNAIGAVHRVVVIIAEIDTAAAETDDTSI